MRPRLDGDPTTRAADGFANVVPEIVGSDRRMIQYTPAHAGKELGAPAYELKPRTTFDSGRLDRTSDEVLGYQKVGSDVGRKVIFD